VVTLGPLGPVDPETGRDPLPVVTLVDVVAQLVRHGSTVAEEFLSPAERVDRRSFYADGGYVAPPRPHALADFGAIPVQREIPRPPPRPNPGRAGWH
jgi:hypothetical protein